MCEVGGGGVAEAGVGCGEAAVAAAGNHVSYDGGDGVEGAGGQGAVGGDFVDVDLLGEGVLEEGEEDEKDMEGERLGMWLDRHR